MKDKKLTRGIQFTFSFVVTIWLIKLVEIFLQVDLGSLGILPRTAQGSVGIFLAPFIHGDFYHLLSNTIPIIVLGVGLFYFYDRIALNVITLIYLMTGFWVWMAARDAYHIGASGVVYGLLTFLLFSGFFRRDRNLLAVSFVILLLYGGSFAYGLFPTSAKVSWESHLMGAIAGIFCAIYYRKYKGSETVKQTEDKTSYIYVYEEHKADIKTYEYQIDLSKSDRLE